MAPISVSPHYWSLSNQELFQDLQSSDQGLTDDKAKQRLEDIGANLLV